MKLAFSKIDCLLHGEWNLLEHYASYSPSQRYGTISMYASAMTGPWVQKSTQNMNGPICPYYSYTAASCADTHVPNNCSVCITVYGASNKLTADQQNYVCFFSNFYRLKIHTPYCCSPYKSYFNCMLSYTIKFICRLFAHNSHRIHSLKVVYLNANLYYSLTLHL